jgi:nitrogen-specific signal transduction histidine kinase
MRALFKKARTTTEWLDMNEAIEEVVILTQSEVLRNRVVLRMELAADLPSVMGDRVQLQQVIVKPDPECHRSDEQGGEPRAKSGNQNPTRRG